MRLALALVALVACAKDSAPEPAPAPEPEPPAPPTFDAAPAKAARPKPPPCSAEAVVTERIEANGAYLPSTFDEPDEHPDLDGDGTPDRVLIAGRAQRAEPYYFLLRRDDCYELVGVMQASPLLGGFRCKDTKTNGLCDLRISRMMIHGETEWTNWTFDGTTYVKQGRAEYSPRPGKFR